ncbi:MAG: hypothetical protein U0169_00705 [Polyangiaceae bacterium]
MSPKRPTERKSSRPLSRAPSAPASIIAPVVRTVEPGRMGAYALFGSIPGFLPLPWVPDLMGRRVRGALVFDLAARHRVGLTPKAREILANPAGIDDPSGLMSQVGKYLKQRVVRRFGPAAMLAPARSAVSTLLLGHLFHRYLAVLRKETSLTLGPEEAKRVRAAIDGALAHVVDVDAPDDEPLRAPPGDDRRDRATIFVDNLLVRAAGAPGWLVRRLEAAFDDLVASGAREA